MLLPFQQKLVGTNRESLLNLLGAAVGLLIGGCINITSLLLARATSRRQQMAVASALGVRRGELVRLAMRETVVLVAMGGTLGVLLADSIVPFMHRYLPPELNFRGPLHLDWIGRVRSVASWNRARTPLRYCIRSRSWLQNHARASVCGACWWEVRSPSVWRWC
jgi:hypothetical protein